MNERIKGQLELASSLLHNYEKDANRYRDPKTVERWRGDCALSEGVKRVFSFVRGWVNSIADTDRHNYIEITTDCPTLDLDRYLYSEEDKIGEKDKA